MKQKLLILPVELSSPPVFSGICAVYSLEYRVVFMNYYFSYVLFLLSVLL